MPELCVDWHRSRRDGKSFPTSNWSSCCATRKPSLGTRARCAEWLSRMRKAKARIVRELYNLCTFPILRFPTGMTEAIIPEELAARVRNLVDRSDHGDVSRAARRIGAREGDL